jgi:hypothetical protein
MPNSVGKKGHIKRATEVCEGKITTAKQLNDAMKDLVPTDAQFQAEFSTCRVTKASLARYYLLALELCYRGEREPEFVPNEDQSEVNFGTRSPRKPWQKVHDQGGYCGCVLQAAR